MKRKVAVIGTGIAGMSCASRLHEQFEITVYEKNKIIGGHTNTVTVDEDGTPVPIDTGFMVYNETTYPNLTRLFSELDVPTRRTNMSFSVQHFQSGLEFSGTGFGGLFAQAKNVFKPSHWKFIMEIDRFNRTCGEVLNDPKLRSLSLGEYCSKRGFSEDFRDRYLIPMSSAVWSSPPGAMLKFPAATLVRFFENHRFLSLNGQLEWRTVVGGSQVYRERLIRPFKDRIFSERKVVQVQEANDGVRVTDGSGNTSSYDAVVLASHADESLQMLASPSALQFQLLTPWHYQANRATLHRDISVMPKAKRAWASWNTRVDTKGISTVYWMNSLQDVSRRKNYFVSINDPGNVAAEKIIKQIDYHHPLYDHAAVATQARLPELNETGKILFCGSYFKYGFHEDALTSGLQAADTLNRRFGK